MRGCTTITQRESKDRDREKNRGGETIVVCELINLGRQRFVGEGYGRVWPPIKKIAWEEIV